MRKESPPLPSGSERTGVDQTGYLIFTPQLGVARVKRMKRVQRVKKVKGVKRAAGVEKGKKTPTFLGP